MSDEAAPEFPTIFTSISPEQIKPVLIVPPLIRPNRDKIWPNLDTMGTKTGHNLATWGQIFVLLPLCHLTK
ncbi:hypothetical protein [Gimesia panareensis]|uniref:hypothetical protein n=1 Tax=Gimesia panareensis TaxID=2527978 RepID=UPI00119DBE99|nr:hypothetical protein [Gimesia panareensis]